MASCKNCKNNKKWIAFFILRIFLGVMIVVGLILLLHSIPSKSPKRGAVVANGPECAKVGTTILLMGGTAVDAAIATLFCEGVTCPQSMGLGGGFIATIYKKNGSIVETLIARETAPLFSTRNMYKNLTEKEIIGGISVAVPGELKGYWELHQKYGKLPWSVLVKPAIHLAKNGHCTSSFLAKQLQIYKNTIINPYNNLYDTFYNQKTQDVYREYEIIKQPQLAKTLEIIARDGENAIYNGGEIGKMLIEDVQRMGGILEYQDLLNYKVRWYKPLEVSLDEKQFKIYTTPLPSSGIILTFIMNLYNQLKTSDRKILHHRLIELFKHAYGQRSRLGDPEFNKEASEYVKLLQNQNFIDGIQKKIYDNMTFNDAKYYGGNFLNVKDHGTANIVVLATNGDAIVVTSTINTIFGAKFRSRTGIILNDEMNDFSIPTLINEFDIPPAPANYIEPNKMPMSSMCPTIILDNNGNVRLLIGAAGGPKITSSIALIIIRYLMLDQDLCKAVQNQRLHHQLFPMSIIFEKNYDKEIVDFLSKTIRHEIEIAPEGSGFAAATAIGYLNDKFVAACDPRIGGSIDVYEDKTDSS